MAMILVADDSETILLLMRTRLEMAGHTVATAADGQEVLDHILPACVEPREVLLLDAMIRRKSGIDALREIRAYRQRRPVADRQRPSEPGRRRRSHRPRDQRLHHQADRLRPAVGDDYRADERRSSRNLKAAGVASRSAGAVDREDAEGGAPPGFYAVGPRGGAGLQRLRLSLQRKLEPASLAVKRKATRRPGLRERKRAGRGHRRLRWPAIRARPGEPGT